MPASSVTSPAAYYNRREFMRVAGAGIAGAAILGCNNGCRADAPAAKSQPPIPADVLAKFPAKRNPAYKVNRALTPADVAGRYNNFYEFTTDKERVHELAKNFRSRPWTLQIAGLVKKPQTIDIDKLIRELPMEERVYRFRCVEAWAMVVPWTGIPLSALLKRVEPLSSA